MSEMMFSEPPASSSSTLKRGFSDSLDAKTAPAVPAPTESFFAYCRGVRKALLLLLTVLLTDNEVIFLVPRVAYYGNDRRRWIRSSRHENDADERIERQQLLADEHFTLKYRAQFSTIFKYIFFWPHTHNHKKTFYFKTFFFLFFAENDLMSMTAITTAIAFTRS